MSSELSIEKYLLIFRTRKWLILGIFGTGIFLAGLVTYLTPKMYTATVSLNFEFNGGNPVADGRGRSVYGEDTYITTQIAIIESQYVAQEVENSLTEYERERLIAALQARSSLIDDVVRSLKAFIQRIFAGRDETDTTRLSPEKELEAINIRSAYSWLARTIGYDLSVEPVFNSRIVKVSYSSPDRQIAALMANKFAEAYLSANLRMIIDPARKTKAWFDEQLKILRGRLEDAQSELTAYQQREGIVSSDERLDTESARLRDLSDQLVAAQQTTRNAVTEREKLREVVQRGASLMTYAGVFENPVVQKIKGEIRALEGELVEVSGSLGENHPTHKRIRSELSAAKARLHTEIQSIADGIDNAGQLAVERERDLAKALEEQKQLVLDLKQEHDKIAVLARGVESAQATYNAALQQMNTTSMQSMVDQTNVSIVDPANVPSRHSSPRVLKNLALGALAGILFGVGLAVLMEIFGRRIHCEDDLEREVEVLLLGHLKKA